MAGEKMQLTKEKETLLITVYGKALESRLPNSLLKDRFADEAVRRIDYDFSRLKVDNNLGVGLAIRAKTLDDWVSAFLANNPNAIVLHLGCGLDTRIFRIDPPAGVDWFDVDYAEVIELRRKLYPMREHYHLIGSSVTEPGWLDEVPGDRPAMVVAEGLTPYLAADEGPRLVSRLVSHLASGEFICDAYSDLGLKLVRLNRSFRATGAELHWAINDPRDLERSVPGLRLVEETMAYKPEHAARVSWFAGLVFRLWSHVPALRRVGRLLRFRF
ncbi:class I SAM-dependent methyltransferase [Mesorhizobium sp. M0923]|uniref:class I SAM-dependent methyltransferase n=1 Tax=unclassified Mesorhizobium TaxID=325217 RepID=UPI0003CF617C|nr:class I SAM-dependent methyltransferase [Mesorhizobium sp. LSHC420B00]ESX80135.1 O-methyltransferase [Mesorhizobium sp. LSHC420B00]